MAGHAISMFFLSARPCAPEVHGEAPLLRRAPPAQARASSQSSSASPASSSSCEAATVACSWGAATAAPQEPLPQRCLVVVVASALLLSRFVQQPASAAAAVRFLLVSQDTQQSSQINFPRTSTTIGFTSIAHLRPPSRAAGPQDVHMHGIHLAGPGHQSGSSGAPSVKRTTPPLSQRQSQAATAACGAEAAEVTMASAVAAEVGRPPPRSGLERSSPDAASGRRWVRHIILLIIIILTLLLIITILTTMSLSLSLSLSVTPPAPPPPNRRPRNLGLTQTRADPPAAPPMGGPPPRGAHGQGVGRWCQVAFILLPRLLRN